MAHRSLGGRYGATEPTGVDHNAAIRLLKGRLAQIPNVKSDPAPDVEIIEFNLARPVLAVRPYCHTAGLFRHQPGDPRRLRQRGLPGARAASGPTQRCFGWLVFSRRPQTSKESSVCPWPRSLYRRFAGLSTNVLDYRINASDLFGYGDRRKTTHRADRPRPQPSSSHSRYLASDELAHRRTERGGADFGVHPNTLRSRLSKFGIQKPLNLRNSAADSTK